jgi:hypothetical protein
MIEETRKLTTLTLHAHVQHNKVTKMSQGHLIRTCIKCLMKGKVHVWNVNIFK